jgi:hypothetical protein
MYVLGASLIFYMKSNIDYFQNCYQHVHLYHNQYKAVADSPGLKSLQSVDDRQQRSSQITYCKKQISLRLRGGGSTHGFTHFGTKNH